MKRSNEKHREVFLVATGNQAMAKSGVVTTTSTSVNIASGQLGVIAATNEQAHLNAGAFLSSTNNPAGSAANTGSDVPAIQIVQGTPNSADTSQNVGWYYEDPAFVKSAIIRAGTVRSFTAQVYALPVLSSTMFSGLTDANVQSVKDYLWSIELRSRRNDRDFGKNVENQPIVFQTPDFTSVTVDSKLDYLLTNMINTANKNSRLWRDNYRQGNRDYVVLGINSSGGNGTAIGGIGLGDTVPFAKNSDNVTLSFTVDRPMLNTLANIIDTASNISTSSTIEVVDYATAGNGELATGTITTTGNFTADDEVTIGAITYIFKASPSNAYEVDLGGSAAVSLANLYAAINASGTAGTEYAADTLENAQVDAVGLTATTLTVRAKNTSTYSGTAGNAIIFTEDTDGGTSWSVSGAGTLTGGLDTNKDVAVFIGLQQPRAIGHDGIAQTTVRVDVEFGEQFQIAPKPTKTSLTNNFEGYGDGTLLKIRYDRRAFGFTGTLELTGHQDEVILAPNYISPSTNYSVFIIDHYDVAETLTVRPQYQKRCYILLPATDDAVSTDADTGVTASTNSSNTVTDLQAILKPWLATAGSQGNAPELLGDATSTTYFS